MDPSPRDVRSVMSGRLRAHWYGMSGSRGADVHELEALERIRSKVLRLWERTSQYIRS